MKAGDLIRRKTAHDIQGLFVGLRKSGDYEYAEVMWHNKPAPNGYPVSTVQKDLIEVVK